MAASRRPTVNRGRFGALVAVIAASALLFFLAPPAPLRVDIPPSWQDLASRTVGGAYHVHSNRSDGHGDRAQIAAAAAKAGLTFVIVTDHGDGTRPPDPAAYINGVLLLDAVEISTDEGHVVALDMRRAPYPLGGAGDAVVDDIHRLGGLAIAAHPDSPKAALRWSSRDALIDGLEWINADSEWRDESRATLVRAGVAYFFRPAPALALVLDRPSTLDRWDAFLRQRTVLAFGASDAHGGPGSRLEDQNRTLLGTVGIPSYEASFRELSLRLQLPGALTGDAGNDARTLYDAIRRADFYTTIDALATPGLLDFHQESSGGGVVARVAGPRDAEIVLIQDQRERARGIGEVRSAFAEAQTSCTRVEVRIGQTPGIPPVPWIVSNARCGRRSIAPVAADESAPPSAAQPIPPFPWRIEKDPASSGILRTGQYDATLEYKLAEGEKGSQFVALATDLQGTAFRAIDLRLASDRPSRVSVQLRDASGRRWARSYYVDAESSQLRVPDEVLRPVGGGEGPPDAEKMTSLLLVIDLTNANPGRSGRLRVLASAFQ